MKAKFFVTHVASTTNCTPHFNEIGRNPQATQARRDVRAESPGRHSKDEPPLCPRLNSNRNKKPRLPSPWHDTGVLRVCRRCRVQNYLVPVDGCSMTCMRLFLSSAKAWVPTPYHDAVVHAAQVSGGWRGWR